MPETPPKPEPARGRYDAAWESASFRDCVRTLMQLTGYKTEAGLERFARTVSADVENARNQDRLPYQFPKFDNGIVKRWVEQGVFEEGDRKFLPFIQRAFHITGGNDNTELYRCFSSERYKAATQVHEEHCRKKYGTNGLTTKKSYFADYLAMAMEDLSISAEELSLRTGIYPAFIHAYENGDIVPQGNALKKITAELNSKNASWQNELIGNLLARDMKRLEVAHAKHPKRVQLVKALGGITRDTYLYEFIDDAFSKNGAEGMKYSDVSRTDSGGEEEGIPLPARMRSKSQQAAKEGRYVNYNHSTASSANALELAQGIAKAVGDDSGLYEKLITEFAFRRHQKKNFSTLLNEYVQTPLPNFRGLIEYVAEQWECSLAHVCDELQISVKGLRAMDRDGYYSTHMLWKLAERQGLTLTQKHNLVAVRKSTLYMGSVEELTNAAQEILSADTPMLADFKGNAIAERISEMPRQKQKKDGVIDKTLVPNALLGVLLHRCGISITQYLDHLDKKPSGRAGDTSTGILNGEQGFLISHGRTRYQFDKAKAAAAFFTEDAAVAENLSLAFLEVGQKLTPDEWMKRVEAKQSTLGEMVRTLRISHLMTKEKLAQEVTGSANPSDVFLTQLEDKNIYKLTPDLAGKLADYFYKDYPDATTKEAFKAALSGRASGKEAEVQKKVLLAEIEGDITAGYDNFGKEKAPTFATLLPKLTRFASNGTALDFSKKAGFSQDRYPEWLNGGKVYRKESANSIADLMVESGMDGTLKPKLIALAMQKVPRYDPSVLEKISVESSAQERQAALVAMRGNLHLSIPDTGVAIQMDPAGYAQFERTGWIEENARGRERRIASIAGAFIPEDVPNAIEQRTKLAQIIGTPPPEVGAAKGRERNV